MYNTTNSLMKHDLVDHIEKNEEKKLLYVACELGGLFVLNTSTGEQKLITKDSGNDVNPQMIDTYISSGHYDETDKKLYVSAYANNGGRKRRFTAKKE